MSVVTYTRGDMKVKHYDLEGNHIVGPEEEKKEEKPARAKNANTRAAPGRSN